MFATKISSSTFQGSLTTIEDLRKLRVKELKQEMEARGLVTNDVFEKEDLVRRLYQHMEEHPNESANFKENESYNDSTSSSEESNARSRNIVSRVPLHYVSLDESPAQANIRNNVSFRPTAGMFPAIKVTIPNSSKAEPLNLLVDKACSGIVLRPSKVKEYGLQVSSNGGVSLTAAGGTASGTGLSQIDVLCLEDRTMHGTTCTDFVGTCLLSLFHS